MYDSFVLHLNIVLYTWKVCKILITLFIPLNIIKHYWCHETRSRLCQSINIALLVIWLLEIHEYVQHIGSYIFIIEPMTCTIFLTSIEIWPKRKTHILDRGGRSNVETNNKTWLESVLVFKPPLHHWFCWMFGTLEKRVNC